MKAILILEMPKYCEDCPCSFFDRWDIQLNLICAQTREYVNGSSKPNWCPLRKLPEKRHNDEILVNSDYWECRGFNKCIDEILGGGR